MDHLQAIRVFARVVEAGSFSKAADSLGMPRPTVTKLVQSLEARLQTKLLNRTTRRVSVTSDGAAYYERTGRLLNELDEIEAGIGNARVSPRGRLRVDVASSIANMIVLPSLPGFVARYPDVLVELGIDDRSVDLIGDNVDCAIRAGVLGDSSLVARRVGELSWITCAAPAYLERAGLPRHPRELEAPQHAVVGFASAQSGRLVPLGFRRGGQSVEVQPRCALIVNEGYAGVVAAIAGLGVVQTVRFLAQRHIDEGRLVPILTDWDQEPYPVYAVYPPNRHLSARLRVFVNWIAELFAQHPYAQGRLPTGHGRPFQPTLAAPPRQSDHGQAQLSLRQAAARVEEASAAGGEAPEKAGARRRGERQRGGACGQRQRRAPAMSRSAR